MQPLLLAAGVLAFVVGAVHSVLGEFLIFRGLRGGGLVPTQGAPVLRERNVRILWATWHAITAFGWAFAALLAWMAFRPLPAGAQAFIENTIALAMFAAALLVLVATKGRHPGWIGLLGVALLTWLN